MRIPRLFLGAALVLWTPASAQELSVPANRIFESPVFTQNENQILARAHQLVAESTELPPDAKDSVQRELDTLPYRRLADLEFAFLTGYPDLLAACIEGHPSDRVAIEACASSAVFITSLQASLKHRWTILNRTSETGVNRALSLGPSAGFRTVRQSFLCIWGSCREPVHGNFLTYGASLEYVSWKNKKVAFTIQGDFGFNHFLGSPDGGEASMIPRPEGKVTFGIAWVKPKAAGPSR